ncbi:CoA transferase [Termitidicoccus mucosus]|uniref:Carnitine dehydratase n=1 Tax=Termitidicoccus mucosus TaxID=1184151 RepID=A0A178IDP4_9BACT|nr:carnitine dehydratase [Opitutaceae bacterium TSB47]
MTATTHQPGALDGVRVLDFTQLLQGPYATQMLGDLGADVIKVERAGTGDLYRSMTFFNEWIAGRESPCFLAWNRNKRSIALDLKRSEGRAVVERMAAQCDVVVENFRPGVMARLGFGYEDCARLNPRIIYCSATGWGRDGPYAERPGQDLLVQGLTGAAFTSGRADAGAVPLGTALCDQLGALHIVQGVLAALYHRERTGRGQEVQVSLLASALAFQAQDFFTIHNLHRSFERPRSGIGHPGNGAPFGIYRTADGWLSIAMNPWDRIVTALGDPSLARYDDPQARFDRRDEVFEAIQKILLARTTDEWLEIMLGLDLWVARAQTQDAVHRDPQVMHENLFTSVAHPVAGEIKMTNVPVRLSATPGSIRRPPPLLGEHGRELLAGFGYDEAEIDGLIAGGVVSIATPPEK